MKSAKKASKACRELGQAGMLQFMQQFDAATATIPKNVMHGWIACRWRTFACWLPNANLHQNVVERVAQYPRRDASLIRPSGAAEIGSPPSRLTQRLGTRVPMPPPVATILTYATILPGPGRLSGRALSCHRLASVATLGLRSSNCSS